MMTDKGLELIWLIGCLMWPACIIWGLLEDLVDYGGNNDSTAVFGMRFCMIFSTCRY